jgi:hypothetical protein
MKISSPKEELEEKEVIPPHRRRLVYGGKKLNNGIFDILPVFVF